MERAWIEGRARIEQPLLNDSDVDERDDASVTRRRRPEMIERDQATRPRHRLDDDRGRARDEATDVTRGELAEHAIGAANAGADDDPDRLAAIEIGNGLSRRRCAVHRNQRTENDGEQPFPFHHHHNHESLVPLEQIFVELTRLILGFSRHLHRSADHLLKLRARQQVEHDAKLLDVGQERGIGHHRLIGCA